MRRVGNYLIAKDITEEGKKTSVFLIKNEKSDDKLGIIKWNNHWRRYCFYPLGDTCFDNQCLLDIIDFIKQLMEGRKGGKVY